MYTVRVRDSKMEIPASILPCFAAGKGLRLTVMADVSPEIGASKQKIQEAKAALREVGLDHNVTQRT